ncbi:MAG: GMP reductase [Gammaproteobacteria bacterium RIFCSPLOWO2_12_FULL_38_14]|nr:MAG: GMP reductase [Gammaproteobacteria bacterium RIFCSPLOWO2_12_FULL_38_14]
MRIEEDIKLDFKDVLIRPKRSTLKSRAEVDLEREYVFKHSHQSWRGIPIIAANMDHTGTSAMAKALTQHSLLTALSKFMTEKNWIDLKETTPSALNFVMISAGTQKEDLKSLENILKIFPIPFICLDVANGYSQIFLDIVKRTRELFPEKTILAGNVVTGEMTEELLISGADIVKIGIGPGSVCTTRKKTGVGYPQLSAIIECADAAHGLKGQVCSDGGCVVPGDLAKAFAAGADFVMLGGMLGGHDECEGELIEIEGKSYKRFYGMSSKEAMMKHRGGVAEYRSSEGKSVNLPYRGPVSETILDILGGLRSTCTYVGAQKLKELSKRTTFLRVTQQLNESFERYNNF